jgi:DNA-binding protein HU-beta
MAGKDVQEAALLALSGDIRPIAEQHPRLILSPLRYMMNTNDLAQYVSEQDGALTKAQAKLLVDAVFAGVREAALKGEEVSVPGFGKFKVQDKPARTGRNPRTGEAVQIAATKKLAFQPAKALKDALGA